MEFQYSKDERYVIPTSNFYKWGGGRMVVMKYKKFLLVLPLLLSFGIIFFSPNKAQAAPCDLVGNSSFDSSTNKFSLLGSGYYSAHNAGAGITSFIIDFSRVYPTGINYRLDFSTPYHCSGTPATSSLFFVLPSGTVKSSNVANHFELNQVGTNPLPTAMAIETGAGVLNPFILPCPLLSDPTNGWSRSTYPAFCNSIDGFYAGDHSTSGISVAGYLSPPYFNVANVAKEDEAINVIAQTGKITISGTGVTADIPATNCVRIGGVDPDVYAASHGGKQPIKVVFMRGKSWNSSVGDFVGQMSSVINNGFKAIDPFASYIGDFSFYVDLKKVDDTNAPTYPFLTSRGQKFFTIDFGESVKQQSSCSPLGDQYLFYFDNASIATFSPFHKVSFMNIFGGLRFDSVEAIHEIGHTFAGLVDEYGDSLYGLAGWATLLSPEPLASNCTLSPSSSYSIRGNSIGNIRYSNIETVGCSGISAPTSPKAGPLFWYRPSYHSIMKDGNFEHRFNVIDCGYVIAAIKRERVGSQSQYKTNASKYWPECINLDTAKDVTFFENITPTLSPPPPPPTSSRFQFLANVFSADMWRSLLAQVGGVRAVGVYQASPNFQVKVYGTNFTPTDNAVQLTNNTTGAIYEVLDIPNTVGQPLTFAVSSTTPQGEYTIKVGAFNSPWSNGLSFSVLAPKIPVIPVFSAYPASVNSGQSTTVTWSSDGAETCTGTANNTVPVSWSNPGFNGSFTFIPNGATTLSLTCVGPGGTKVATLQISGNTTSKPVVTLNANPGSLITGNGTTLSWTAYNATSCVGGSSSGFFSSAWNKSQPTSGSLYITPTQDSTLTLACTGLAGVSTTTTYITLTNTNNLAVSCSVYPSATLWNGLVTFTATATGGNGPYTYSWTGNDGLVGNTPSVSNYYFSSPIPNYVYYKTAAVTVTSGGQSVIKQCPNIPINPSTASGGYMPTIYSINSPQGILGSQITLVGSFLGYSGSSGTAVVLESGGKTSYIRPKMITNVDARGTRSLDFDFYPSIPLPSTPGTIYNISVQNGIGLRSNSVPFTLASSVPISVPTPILTQISPTSAAFGLVSTPITLSGTGFTSASVVTAKQGNNIRTFVPSAVSPTSITFGFFPDSFITGALTLSVSNQGITSNEIGFTLAGQNPSCTLTTPVVTGSGPYNVKVPVSVVNGPPMTTYYLYRSNSSTPGYVKTGYITTGSSGSTNISISDSSAIPAGTYSYTILGNKVDAPKCSPAQTITVGTVTPPIVPPPTPLPTPTCTISTPTVTGTGPYNISVPISLSGPTLGNFILLRNGQEVDRDKAGNFPITDRGVLAGTYTYTVTGPGLGVIKCSPARTVTVGSGTVTTPVTSTPTPVTVLPWTVSTNTAFVGQPFTYTLNWSGGPLDKSWRVFAHMVKDDGSYYFTGGDFIPTPTTDKWTGNTSTTNTITIPAGTPPGTYKVMVGLYNGVPRVTTLIAGPNVSTENPTQYRYQVGTITILAPINTQPASIWDSIKGLFGF